MTRIRKSRRRLRLRAEQSVGVAAALLGGAAITRRRRRGRESFSATPLSIGSSFSRKRLPTPLCPNRRGFTLVEMLVVMTVFVFLLASAALAIGTLFRAQSELQDELAQAAITARLAAQLRADAHLADSAEIVGEGRAATVLLRLPDAEVNYATHPRRIIRTVTAGETQTHREVFSLLEGTTVDWQLASGTPSFITLITSYRAPQLREGVARMRRIRVEASVGFHRGGVR